VISTLRAGSNPDGVPDGRAELVDAPLDDGADVTADGDPEVPAALVNDVGNGAANDVGSEAGGRAETAGVTLSGCTRAVDGDDVLEDGVGEDAAVVAATEACGAIVRSAATTATDAGSEAIRVHLREQPLVIWAPPSPPAPGVLGLGA
jgi:hypothetical protein